MKQSVYDTYIPTPLRRKLGLPVDPESRTRCVTDSLSEKIDSSGGPGSCWPWIGKTDRDGYGIANGSKRAHRLVWAEFYGVRLDPNLVIRHDCDNPTCCNPLHLTGGSQLANVADRVSKQRSARGIGNGRNKLTLDQVREIYLSSENPKPLGLRFGIHEATVRGIKTGKTWKWLTKSIPKTRSVFQKKKSTLKRVL